jgi:glycosyltransferase involved in cell wall biosynthesis
MDEINVILISSVRPEKSMSAAQLTLHRHLMNRRGIRLHILPAEHHEIVHGRFHSKIVPRLMRTAARRWAGDIDYLMHTTLPLETRLVAPPRGTRTVVLTLAYGSGCWVAQRYARWYRVPLIVRFDDWWPDIAEVHNPVRRQLEQRFLELHRSADLSLCISEGMLKALGPHRNARVILPIPEAQPLSPSKCNDSAGAFRVGYSGNMFDYSDMLADLAQLALKQSDVRIEFRGRPRWPQALADEMRHRHLLHNFIEAGAGFDDWLGSFDAYLVAMFFDAAQRRRTETCFAAKLVEYSRAGRPVVIWAPESSAVVQWAKKNNAALCVTDPDGRAVLSAVAHLKRDRALQLELAARMRRAYETEFSPVRLQQQFLEALSSVV